MRFPHAAGLAASAIPEIGLHRVRRCLFRQYCSATFSHYCLLLCIIRSAAMRIFAVLVSKALPYIRINKSGGDADDILRFFNCPIVRRKKTVATNILASYKNWRKYRETYSELMRLTSRELNDLGINRGDITQIAKQSAGY